MTNQVCVDGVFLGDAVLAVCVDGVDAEMCVDGVTVHDVGAAAPIITTSTTIGAVAVGTAITAWLPTNTGGTPAVYSIVAGAIPAGLAFNAAAGQISGTPTTAGLASWTVRATNGAGSSDYADSVTVAAALLAPNITTSATLDAANDNDGDISNGVAITAWNPISTGGAVASYAIVAGALPTGLSINAGTGTITGTPTVDGAYTWTVRATNATGTSDFADAVTVTAALAAPIITTSTTLDAANDNDGNITNGNAITAWNPTSTGGAVASYAVSAGVLPTGLALNALTGQITGTPTVAAAFAWTVRATNATGTSDFADAITVGAAGTIAFTPLLSGNLGQQGAGGSTAALIFSTGRFDKNANNPPDFVGDIINGSWHSLKPATVGAAYEVFVDVTALTADWTVTDPSGATAGFVPLSANAFVTLKAIATGVAFLSAGNMVITIREIANPANTVSKSFGAAYTP